MITLKTSVRELGGVGDALALLLKKLHIETCKDLIFYFPYRFDDFSKCVLISQVQSGEHVTLKARIELIANRRLRNKRKMITECVVSDESGKLKIVWFNQPYFIHSLAVGDWVAVAGKITSSLFDSQLINPFFEKIPAEKVTQYTGSITPVYSLTAKLSQKQLRTLIKKSLEVCSPHIREWLPEKICHAENLCSFPQAVQSIHVPKTTEDFNRSLERLKFDELFFFQLCSQFLKKDLASKTSYPIHFDMKELSLFLSQLPFSLTQSQKQTLREVQEDMSKTHPMSRLIQGDVGSGKTCIAAAATYAVSRSGFQSLFLAPTEILAQQHFETFSNVFKKYPIRIALVTAQQIRTNHESRIMNHEKRKERKILFEQIEHGEIDSIIGTHALLQEKMKFARVALAIIDEQHRFGVKQRKALRDKNQESMTPHLLSLSATPIPRTLCMTLYGDLDVSSLKEVPLGRKKIITKIVPREYREWTYDFIRKEVKKGRQVFVLCPLIDPSDVLGTKSVKQEFELLKKNIFPDLRIGVLHGKMKSEAKEHIMIDMKEGRIDILIATSVIEVGIHISNASCMIVEGAERFGLAQLHQLRGRVGRSDHQSYCFLFPTEYDHDLSERLEIFAECSDGFALAEKDLELRGVGDMIGTRQSGMPNLKIARLTDHELIKKTRYWAQTILEEIDLYPALKKRVEVVTRETHGE